MVRANVKRPGGCKMGESGSLLAKGCGGRDAGGDGRGAVCVWIVAEGAEGEGVEP